MPGRLWTGPDEDRWVEILREGGFLPTGRIGVLSFRNVSMRNSGAPTTS
jgi:hypothetical protein